MKHCVIQTQSYIVECRTVNVMSIASSGLRAATLGVQAAASNVARLPVADATRIGVARAAAAGTTGCDCGHQPGVRMPTVGRHAPVRQRSPYADNSSSSLLSRRT
ncbi:hypothetical protein DBR34_04980 [Stenotrophomonas sp. HMWF003]|nr:hypothetical protein DBR34_04980 [Stenotrophomonas sp. HMWF003]